MVDSKALYTTNFYNNQKDKSYQSAQIVLGEVFKYFKPASMVDFGCGSGAWLSVAKELGVESIAGLDGDWVNEKVLFIDKSDFKKTNLNFPQRFIIKVFKIKLITKMELNWNLIKMLNRFCYTV